MRMFVLVWFSLDDDDDDEINLPALPAKIFSRPHSRFISRQLTAFHKYAGSVNLERTGMVLLYK